MALTLGDNFSYQGAKPLDARLTYNSLAAMKAVADATMYEGCLAYCTATGKTYQWKSTNTVDETLGKWREFESGGSGGTSDYNDLDNLPKINNTEIKGSLSLEDLGIDIPTKTSELTNDSNFITGDDLPETDGAIDLSKFKAPGTAGQVEGHIYSTDETVVGKWIDGKPLYERTISKTNLNYSTGDGSNYHIISLEDVIPYATCTIRETGTPQSELVWGNSVTPMIHNGDFLWQIEFDPQHVATSKIQAVPKLVIGVRSYSNENNILISLPTYDFTDGTWVTVHLNAVTVTVRYTKTTD